MTLLLLTGIGIACLPKILIAALIIALFLLILWLICSRILPEPWRPYANAVVLIVLLIVLLVVLIQIYSYGLNWVC